MEPENDISRERFVQNALDIEESLPFIGTAQLVDATVGFMHGCLVQFLNDNGHELAAQALDDAWHPRDEQWWRKPDGFDTRYKHGQELLDERGL